MKFLVIYGRKEGVSKEINAQELVIYATSWEFALEKAKEYEEGFIGLEIKQLTKMQIMKKTIYKTVAYQKGATGRKGQIKMSEEFNCMSEAIRKLQEWIYQHEDIYYYSIEREITIENE